MRATADKDMLKDPRLKSHTRITKESDEEIKILVLPLQIATYFSYYMKLL